MSRYALLFMLFVGVVICTVPSPAYSTVESSVVNTLSVPGTPVDSTSSGDGSLFFVLTSDSKVYIFSNSGQLKGELSVQGQPDIITSSSKGDLIYLTDTDDNGVQIVAVDFVQNIETAGSFFKGPENAPVVVAIFSDFQ